MSLGWVRAALVAIGATASLAACSPGGDDLQTYVAEVKARPGTGIEPMPTLRPHEPFVYPGHERSPFDSTVIAQPLGEPDGIAGSVEVDFDRPREFLEGFPLDSLRMVGTMQQDGELFALVRTPDRTVQRVRSGNWMGQNFGRIVAVTPTSIELVEVVADPFGGFIERDNSVQVSE